VPRKTKILPVDRALWSFGGVIYSHFFIDGTRPDGKPDDPIGRLWSPKEAMDALNIASPRTFWNWVDDQHLPYDTVALERVLFDKSTLFNAERLELQEKLLVTRARNAAKAALESKLTKGEAASLIPAGPDGNENTQAEENEAAGSDPEGYNVVLWRTSDENPTEADDGRSKDQRHETKGGNPSAVDPNTPTEPIVTSTPAAAETVGAKPPDPSRGEDQEISHSEPDSDSPKQSQELAAAKQSSNKTSVPTENKQTQSQPTRRAIFVAPNKTPSPSWSERYRRYRRPVATLAVGLIALLGVYVLVSAPWNPGKPGKIVTGNPEQVDREKAAQAERDKAAQYERDRATERDKAAEAGRATTAQAERERLAQVERDRVAAAEKAAQIEKAAQAERERIAEAARAAQQKAAVPPPNEPSIAEKIAAAKRAADDKAFRDAEAEKNRQLAARRADVSAQQEGKSNARQLAEMGFSLMEKTSMIGGSVGKVYAHSVVDCALKCLADNNCGAFAFNHGGLSTLPEGKLASCYRFRAPGQPDPGNVYYSAGQRVGRPR
jgi:hypothetical protein